MTTCLWWIRPETFHVTSSALALLSGDERAQQQRFIPAAKQHEYLVTRVMVRTVLGRMLGLAPAALTFSVNQWGRPTLSPGVSVSPLYFNISHADGLIVLLVSSVHEVGVDTELLSRAPNLLALAPRVFAPRELNELAALPIPDQAKRAVVLWTLKESYIKARGMGLALALDGFAFRVEGERIRLEIEPALNDDGARWQFQTHLLGAHCVSSAIAHPATQPIEINFNEAFA